MHETAALLVSSSHRDANSRVEFLGDEQSSSAWRPNPPDPAPWFELRLALEVEVRSLSVSALRIETTPPVELELHSRELGTARRQSERYVFQPDKPVRTSSVRVSIKLAGATPPGAPAAAIALRELQVDGVVATAQVLPRALPEGRAHRSGPVASIDTPAFRSFCAARPTLRRPRCALPTSEPCGCRKRRSLTGASLPTAKCQPGL